MSSAKSPQVAVITDPEDAHLSFVQRHLQNPLVVIDPVAVSAGTEMSFALEGQTIVASYGGVRLDAMSGVWYRKPREIMPEQLPVSRDIINYSLSALQNHTLMILGGFGKARWVSDYYAIRRASNKALQLQVAAQLGLPTPRTIMTSDPERAREFLEAEGMCIVKAQCAYSPDYTGPLKSFLTTKINAKKPPTFDNLRLAPSIFQQHIDAVFDVRVTVVGGQVFPAIIRNKGLDENGAVRDWRMGFYQGELVIEPFEQFPAEVAERCVAHAKRLGLNFSAIDLVMDKRGRLWFLENNANGQWAFVEKETDQPIGRALAQLLEKRE